MSTINLRILTRDAEQGELTVEMLLEDLKDSLESTWGDVFLNAESFDVSEMKFYKHKDFKKVWKEMIANYKNKIIKIASDVNVINYTNERGKGSNYLQELANLLIKNYFKYVVTIEGHATFWYRNKSDAMELLDSEYEFAIENEDEFDMSIYTLKGFTYDPSK